MNRWPAMAAAMAMARPSELEQRVRAILHGTRTRRPIGRRASLAVALGFAITLVPLPGLRPRPALGCDLIARDSAVAATAPPITLHRATSHPMRYQLALPAHWAPGRSWPVVVVIPDASR